MYETLLEFILTNIDIGGIRISNSRICPHLLMGIDRDLDIRIYLYVKSYLTNIVGYRYLSLLENLVRYEYREGTQCTICSCHKYNRRNNNIYLCSDHYIDIGKVNVGSFPILKKYITNVRIDI